MKKKKLNSKNPKYMDKSLVTDKKVIRREHNTFGTGVIDEAAIEALVREHFDLRPKGLIEMLDLKRPIYLKTAAYGHFGREDKDFTWEATDKKDLLPIIFIMAL